MSWERVAKAGEIAQGKALLVPVGGQQIAVFFSDGKYYALDAVCPHRGGPLAEGEIEGGDVVCPWHAWSFNLETGACSVTPHAAQKTYPVKLQDGDVLVEL